MRNPFCAPHLGAIAVLALSAVSACASNASSEAVRPSTSAGPRVEGMFGTPNADRSTCSPTVSARENPVGSHPDMVWIYGGEFSMGSSNSKFDDARPWHRVRLHGFWLARTAVTNDQFARFVRATGYLTIAERKPRAQDFPDAPPDSLVPGSLVFSPPDHPVELNDDTQWWA